jgi:hypothetical protein
VQVEQELSMGALHYLDPTHPFVAARLLEGGGRMRKWHCVSRLNGELGVSRALGDADYKGAARMGAYPWCWPKGVPPRSFAADLVLAEPAVQLARVPRRSCAAACSMYEGSAASMVGERSRAPRVGARGGRRGGGVAEAPHARVPTPRAPTGHHPPHSTHTPPSTHTPHTPHTAASGTDHSPQSQ